MDECILQMFFVPLRVQDIVDTHPGLTFLKDAPEFHSRYITTVSNVSTIHRLEKSLCILVQYIKFFL